MPPEHPRLRRERQTIQAMFGIYCRNQHGAHHRTLCPACQALEDYALERLQRCPFQENKSVCAKCTVHCYKPDMRQQVRVVMRYAGPKMLLYHPVLAIRHLLDERRQLPIIKINHRDTENTEKSIK
jgi:hypothetical protein